MTAQKKRLQQQEQKMSDLTKPGVVFASDAGNEINTVGL
jgi:hypothetical protein